MPRKSRSQLRPVDFTSGEIFSIDINSWISCRKYQLEYNGNWNSTTLPLPHSPLTQRVLGWLAETRRTAGSSAKMWHFHRINSSFRRVCWLSLKDGDFYFLSGPRYSVLENHHLGIEKELQNEISISDKIAQKGAIGIKNEYTQIYWNWNCCLSRTWTCLLRYVSRDLNFAWNCVFYISAYCLLYNFATLEIVFSGWFSWNFPTNI